MRTRLFSIAGPGLSFIRNRRAFTIIYMVLCISWFIPLASSFTDPLIELCFIWGILLLVNDILTERDLFHSFKWQLLFLFSLSYGITIIMHLQHGFYDNLKLLVYNAICLFVIYPQSHSRSRKDLYTYISLFNTVFIVLIFLLGTISIFEYVFQLSSVVPTGGGNFASQGVHGGRLWGVYTSPNIGALFGLLSILAGLANRKLSHNRYTSISRYLLVPNAVIQLIYLYVSISRGGLLTLIAIILLWILIFWNRRTRWVKISIIALALGICAVSIIGISVQQRATDTMNERLEHTAISRFIERIANTDVQSDARVRIWMTSSNLVSYSPLFGLGNVKNIRGNTRIPEDAAILQDPMVGAIERLYGNTHNLYIQILVCSGFIGLTLMILFLFFSLRRILVSTFRLSTHTDDKASLLGYFGILLSALLINGVVEAHLLFNTQDPFSVLFWFYLGISMQLIQVYRKEALEKSKKIAIVCDTPYQIMNAVNLTANTRKSSRDHTDLFVYKQFGDAHRIIENLRSISIFSAIHEVEPYSTQPVSYTKARTFFRLLFPKTTLSGHSDLSSYRDSAYRTIFYSFSTHFTMNLRSVFNDSTSAIIEDGISSYVSDIEKESSSGSMRFFKRYIMAGTLDLSAERAYFNRPELATNDIAEDLCALPALTHGNPAIPLIKKVFSYSQDGTYNFDPIVYLTQPLEEMSGYIADSDTKLLARLQQEQIKDFIIRVHPRMKHFESNGISVDTSEVMWELVCLEEITDNHLLISCFSTAAIMPKLLYDKEPYMIFTYKLFFQNPENEFWSGVESFLDKVNNLYTKRHAIYIPDSLDELIDIVKRIKHELS